MDEFSWFVGLYEGEGCFTHWLRSGKYDTYAIVIKMTDEDTIARASKFLGVGYCKVKSKHKQLYRVRKQGGKTGDVWDLILKMKPHLSARRQEQIENATK
jgi:hypothetical protein